jgi:hypothetical protein
LVTPGRVRQADPFELDAGVARPVEQPHAITKQDRRDVDQDLVQQPRIQALLGGRHGLVDVAADEG